jgi:hypothetical protein
MSAVAKVEVKVNLKDVMKAGMLVKALVEMMVQS